MKSYRRPDNSFCGNYQGTCAPGDPGFPFSSDVVETASAPTDGNQVWNGSAWVDPANLQDTLANRSLDGRYGPAADKSDRLTFEVMFDLESRMRVLEGKPAINRTQYRNGLIAVWKSLP